MNNFKNEDEKNLQKKKAQKNFTQPDIDTNAPSQLPSPQPEVTERIQTNKSSSANSSSSTTSNVTSNATSITSANQSSQVKSFTWPNKAEKKLPLQVEKERTAKLTEELLKDKKAHEDADYARARANAANHTSSKAVQKIEAEALEKLDKITDEFRKGNEAN